ncbi:hypothetical protein KKG22_01495 [Patescibacteria group bacterium]|nr:hypothetical protein [Patescibacteria group bacterium]MBU1721769.1 hypothetical protein [Patescibacteria group bacterium]MBU1901392.1 hypothetical protein [Patescibacteria group bacterium]
MSYLNWKQITLNDFSAKNITEKYNEGYYFGRIGKGIMTQTRLLRIDLEQFELSSENRRILRKTEDIVMKIKDIPYTDYHWSLGKMGKDFYDKKFGIGTFSANKMKEVLSNTNKTNFNRLFVYRITEDGLAAEFCHCHIDTDPDAIEETKSLPVGYTICYENENILHYSYPFYNLEFPNKNIGMGMMIRAIEYAKKQGKHYMYVGSVQRPTDHYKLQFAGLEWFDGAQWQTNLDVLKEIVSTV